MISLSRAALVATIPLLLAACAAIPVAPGAERVKLTNQEPQGCEQLGDVVGTQGNVVSGAWTSDESLISGARNDLKNKAAALGANVVHVLATTSGQTKGGMTSAHMEGVAYRCSLPATSP
jgi:hypothetical protein